MRKPLSHGRRFAAGRRVVGKSLRAAEQTGLGKGVRENGVGPVAVPAASETVEGQESGVGPVAVPAASETVEGQESGVD
jgi:hypothetical protein